MEPSLKELRVLIRGAGEMASGIALRLVRSGFKVAMTEVERPLAVRRAVSFCEAVWDGACRVEGVTAVLVRGPEGFDAAVGAGQVPVLVDPGLACLAAWRPHVLLDAVLAKRNVGTRRGMADLVVGFGPGFTAGGDVDLVIETNRGHNLGRVYAEGAAEPDTGIPGDTAGYTVERVLRAPADGPFETNLRLGDPVAAGQTVAQVVGVPVRSQIAGVLRGLIRPGIAVTRGLKVGDVDPRGDAAYCDTVSEKARCLGGAALEAILGRFNR